MSSSLFLLVLIFIRMYSCTLHHNHSSNFFFLFCVTDWLPDLFCCCCFFQINLKTLNMMASNLLLAEKTVLEVCMPLVGCVAG